MDRPIGSTLINLLCLPAHREFICRFTLANESLSVNGTAIVESGNDYIRIIANPSDILFKNEVENPNVITISSSDVPPEYECVITDIQVEKLNDVRLHGVSFILPRVRIVPTLTFGNSTRVEGKIQPLYTKDGREIVRFVLPNHNETR